MHEAKADLNNDFKHLLFYSVLMDHHATAWLPDSWRAAVFESLSKG